MGGDIIGEEGREKEAETDMRATHGIVHADPRAGPLGTNLLRKSILPV